MKPKSRWPNAHLKLKRLYEDRAPKGMSQGKFGELYEIGTQGMVWQYLHGYRPLNIEAAAKFARGLRCTIFDICPEMTEELYPVLGKPLRRAAAVLLCLLAPYFTPSDAKAETAFNITRIHIAWRRFRYVFLASFAT